MSERAQRHQMIKVAGGALPLCGSRSIVDVVERHPLKIVARVRVAELVAAQVDEPELLGHAATIEAEDEHPQVRRDGIGSPAAFGPFRRFGDCWHF
jgi:hypothetical protein